MLDDAVDRCGIKGEIKSDEKSAPKSFIFFNGTVPNAEKRASLV